MERNDLRVALITFWRQQEIRCSLDMTIDQLVEKWDHKKWSFPGENFYRKYIRIIVVDVFDLYASILIVFRDLMYVSPIAPFKMYV